MTTENSAPKKRVRRAKRAVKRAMPLENKSNARKAVRIGAIGAGAWIAAKVAWSVTRFVVGSALVIAAAAAAVTLVPKETQRQIAGSLRGAALLTRDKVLEQAKTLSA